MSALSKVAVVGEIRRVAQSWLRDRPSQVRLRAATDVYSPSIYSITRGLPQEGRYLPCSGLSFLTHSWGIFVVSRPLRGGGAFSYKDLINADDITGIVTADSLSRLEWLAAARVTDVRFALSVSLDGCALSPQEHKSTNI